MIHSCDHLIGNLICIYNGFRRPIAVTRAGSGKDDGLDKQAPAPLMISNAIESARVVTSADAVPHFVPELAHVAQLHRVDECRYECAGASSIGTVFGGDRTSSH